MLRGGSGSGVEVADGPGGGSTAGLPPEVWRLVLHSGILARRAAAVCRMFEDIWRTHEDLVVPGEGGSEDGAESVDGSVDSWATWSYASDDGPPMPPPIGAAYQCCECGLWSPDDVPYSETLVGPEGEPLTRRRCHAAMLWLQMWTPEPPHSAAALDADGVGGLARGGVPWVLFGVGW